MRVCLEGLLIPRPRRVLCLIGILAIAEASCQGGESGSGSAALPPDDLLRRPANDRLLVEFVPMTDPLSRVVSIAEDGTVRTVSYSAPRLEVVAVGRTGLPIADATKLFDRIREPGIDEALRRRSFAGSGLRSGDQFYLFMRSRGRVGVCFGFLEDAPPAVSRFVEELLRLEAGSESQEIAAHYLRVETLEARRLESLPGQGRAVRRWASAPSDLRVPIERAVQRPREFHALTDEEHEGLAEWCGEPADCFLTRGESGYQLALYSSRQQGTQE